MLNRNTEQQKQQQQQKPKKGKVAATPFILDTLASLVCFLPVEFT